MSTRVWAVSLGAPPGDQHGACPGGLFRGPGSVGWPHLCPGPRGSGPPGGGVRIWLLGGPAGWAVSALTY